MPLVVVNPETTRRQLNRKLLLGWLGVTLLGSLIRIGALWAALRALWEGETAQPADNPLTCLLYPEAMLIPVEPDWTQSNAVLFSLLLLAGTGAFAATWVVMFAPLLRALLTPDSEPPAPSR